jgi:dihydrofolate reductase
MRKIKMGIYVSLDGVIEAPAWTVPSWNDELSRLQRETLFSAEALLLGRVTYELFAASWPGTKDDEGFADRMNSIPKFVASRTLGAAGWNATVLRGEAAVSVAELKRSAGGDLLIWGSSRLVTELTPHDLIDEYRLMVHPVAVGKGKRLFDGLAATSFRLVKQQTTTKGVVVLDYEQVK